jgi:hypothetical protein
MSQANSFFGALLLSPFFLAGAGHPALACSCAKLTFTQAMAQTPIVFEGRVMRVRRERDSVYADIEMSRVLKGSVPRIVEVGTPTSSAACGYVFKAGERLTVGVRLAQQMFTTSICTMGPLNPR